MKVPMEVAIGTLRLSTGRHTTNTEVDAAAAMIAAAAKDQRKAAAAAAAAADPAACAGDTAAPAANADTLERASSL